MAQCSNGKPCGSTCIEKSKKCRMALGDMMSSSLSATKSLVQEAVGEPFDPKKYADWEVHAKGLYGEVSYSPDGTKAVKVVIKREDGKGFGEYEVELGSKLGELGVAPKVYSFSDRHIEMERIKGKPLWETYQKQEGDEPMNVEQALSASKALRSIHRLGFFHGDIHNFQFMVNGNDVKIVDFGLSRPVEEDPRKVIQDLNKAASLLAWDNPALDRDPYVRLVRKYRDMYRNSPSNKREEKEYESQVGRQYLEELMTMEFTS